MKKKILSLLTLICILSFLFIISANAEDETPDLTNVKNVYVYNSENDRVLLSQNSTEKVAPASTVKIMTGMLALEHFEDRYGEIITISSDNLGKFQGKNINLKKDEVVTVEHLLYATICGGANDAANVLAYETAGSHQAFLDMMNEKAQELGMKDTYYTNAYGYSDTGMYTTAEDTLLLAKYAYTNSKYMEMCSGVRFEMPATNKSKIRYIYNSNYLIATNVQNKYKNNEVMGMNAGSTSESGHVVVTVVTRNGMTNFFVLMCGKYDDENIYSYIAANELIDWSFKSFGYKKIIDSSEMICEVKVNLSNQIDYVILCPEKTLEYYLPVSVDVDKDIKREINLTQNELEAPIEAGYVAGTLTLSYNNGEIAKINLITKNNVNRNGFLYLLARIKNFTKSQTFKTALIIIAVLVVLYIIIAIEKRIRKNRYRTNRPRRFGR